MRIEDFIWMTRNEKDMAEDKPPTRDPIPEFETMEDIAAFWDTHSTADYEDLTHEVHCAGAGRVGGDAGQRLVDGKGVGGGLINKFTHAMQRYEQLNAQQRETGRRAEMLFGNLLALSGNQRLLVEGLERAFRGAL